MAVNPCCNGKDCAQKELQQKTKFYQSYIRQLEQQIEEQNKLIAEFKLLLRSTTKHASDEALQKYPAMQKQEVECSSSCNHHTDHPSCSHHMLLMTECMETAVMPPLRAPGNTNVERKGVLDMLRELHGQFKLIKALTQRQTDHLRKLKRKGNTANEQQFSIPIQCTDESAERSEGPLRPFPTTVGSQEEVEQEDWPGLAPVSPLPSQADSEDQRFADFDHLLAIRFPPTVESEYAFLNSVAGKPVHAVADRPLLVGAAAAPLLTEEQPLVTAVLTLAPCSGFASDHPIHEAVRGPQQSLWTPDLCDANEQGGSDDPTLNTDPRKCEFCNSFVPRSLMYSHLNSHFQSPSDTGH
ncbi:hypothetical protein GJAV_G00211930 [Gymnothorax javanicus]|nr:hypothetical protein GJAV_G00211930 [Gymnothorax javanicus]